MEMPPETLLLIATIGHAVEWLAKQEPELPPGGGVMSEGIWQALIAAAAILGPAATAGGYKLYRDQQRMHRQAIKEAEERALAQARLEAVAREAQAALEAKTAEVEELRAQLASCAERESGTT